MFYFVVYQLSINGERRPPGNTILELTHPLQWAARKQENGVVTYLLWWTEINASLFHDASVAKHFTIER